MFNRPLMGRPRSQALMGRPRSSSDGANQAKQKVTAPEPTSFVWEDLDMYYYKQMAASIKDTELQQKIEREIKMRDGIAKLLAASKHPHQLMEAARNMLVSNTRVLAYMSELQRRKTEEILKKHELQPPNQSPCRGKVSVSDIRLPLMWKDTDHFKNKGDHRRYAVFCLLKIGTDVYDTILLNDVDRSKTDICFDDVIVFNCVSPDFTLELEVYSHQLHEDVSIASTPRRLHRKITEISSSMGRTVGKRLSGLKEEEIMNSLLVGPRFERIAHATLKLSDVQDRVATYDLVLDNPDAARCDATSSIDLPLFDNFCCQISAQPNSLIFNVVETFLSVHADNPVGRVNRGGRGDLSERGDPSARRYWCTLKNRQISCWASRDDAETCDPDLAIPINKYTAVSEMGALDTDRDHCIKVTYLSSHGGKFTRTLRAENQTDHVTWWEALQQHLLDQVMWQHACDKLMEIKTPMTGLDRANSARRKKTSLYDEIPGSYDIGVDKLSIGGSSSSSQSQESSPSWQDRSSSTRHHSSSSRSEASFCS